MPKKIRGNWYLVEGDSVTGTNIDGEVMSDNRGITLNLGDAAELVYNCPETSDQFPVDFDGFCYINAAAGDGVLNPHFLRPMIADGEEYEEAIADDPEEGSP